MQALCRSADRNYCTKGLPVHQMILGHNVSLQYNIGYGYGNAALVSHSRYSSITLLL